MTRFEVGSRWKLLVLIYRRQVREGVNSARCLSETFSLSAFPPPASLTLKAYPWRTDTF